MWPNPPETAGLVKFTEENLNGKLNFFGSVGNYLTKYTAWKVSKNGVFFGTYFPVFSSNMGKYGLEKTPYLDTSHAVIIKRTYP